MLACAVCHSLNILTGDLTGNQSRDIYEIRLVLRSNFFPTNLRGGGGLKQDPCTCSTFKVFNLTYLHVLCSQRNISIAWSVWYVHVPLQLQLWSEQTQVHAHIQANPSCTYHCTSQLCTTSDLFSTAPKFVQKIKANGEIANFEVMTKRPQEVFNSNYVISNIQYHL